jgi:hypothetical protein
MLTSRLSLFRAGALHFSSYTFLLKGHAQSAFYRKIAPEQYFLQRSHFLQHNPKFSLPYSHYKLSLVCFAKGESKQFFPANM